MTRNRNEYARNYRRNNKEQKLAYERNWRNKNREKVRAAGRQYAKTHKHVRREYYIKNKYGIGLVEYEAMLDRQKHKCPICGCELNQESRPSIDHCHKTNKVRSILCLACNSVIGYAKDNPYILRRAADYCYHDGDFGIK